jgi:hypothetical protein
MKKREGSNYMKVFPRGLPNLKSAYTRNINLEALAFFSFVDLTMSLSQLLHSHEWSVFIT